MLCAIRPHGLDLINVGIDHLDGPDDEDFAGIAGFEERIAFTEGNFRLIHSGNAVPSLAQDPSNPTRSAGACR